MVLVIDGCVCMCACVVAVVVCMTWFCWLVALCGCVWAMVVLRVGVVAVVCCVLACVGVCGIRCVGVNATYLVCAYRRYSVSSEWYYVWRYKVGVCCV